MGSGSPPFGAISAQAPLKQGLWSDQPGASGRNANSAVWAKSSTPDCFLLWSDRRCACVGGELAAHGLSIAVQENPVMDAAGSSTPRDHAGSYSRRSRTNRRLGCRADLDRSGSAHVPHRVLLSMPDIFENHEPRTSRCICSDGVVRGYSRMVLLSWMFAFSDKCNHTIPTGQESSIFLLLKLRQ